MNFTVVLDYKCQAFLDVKNYIKTISEKPFSCNMSAWDCRECS